MDNPVLLPLLILPLLWILMSLVFALAWPSVGGLVRSLHPQYRFLFALIYALLPLLMAGAVAVLVFTPLIGGINLTGHCHDLECSAHVPVWSAGPVTAALLSSSLLSGGFAILFLPAVSVWRNYRITGMLLKLSDEDSSQRFRVLDTDAIVACCTGLLWPGVVISRGLKDRIDPGQLDIVVRHELAHACRFDNLFRLVASWATLPWPESGRHRLLAELELASEQACDDHVAASIQSRSRVAVALRTVARLKTRDTLPDNSQSDCKARVALLEQTRVDESMQGWKTAVTVLTGSAALLIVVADVLHRATEVWMAATPVVY